MRFMAQAVRTHAARAVGWSVVVGVWVLLAGGRQHSAAVGRRYHETDEAYCAAIARGTVLHASLDRMRADGTCNVWVERN